MVDSMHRSTTCYSRDDYATACRYGRRRATLLLLRAMGFLAAGVAGVVWVGYRFSHGLTAVERFWVVLPLATLGLALFAAAASVVALVRCVPLFFRGPRGPGSTAEITLRTFYAGVLPTGPLDIPPYHDAWLCLTAAARSRFQTLGAFCDHWRQLRDSYFPCARWEIIEVSDLRASDSEREVRATLAACDRHGNPGKARWEELVLLRGDASAWCIHDAQHKQQQEWQAHVSETHTVLLAEGWVPCSNCGVPVHPERSRAQGGLCDACGMAGRRERLARQQGSADHGKRG